MLNDKNNNKKLYFKKQWEKYELTQVKRKIPRPWNHKILELISIKKLNSQPI